MRSKENLGPLVPSSVPAFRNLGIYVQWKRHPISGDERDYYVVDNFGDIKRCKRLVDVYGLTLKPQEA